MNADDHGEDRLLTRRQVAAIFRVSVKTVTRWESAGKLRSVQAQDGLVRYLESEVRLLLSRSSIPEGGHPPAID